MIGTFLDLSSGLLNGEAITEVRRTVGDLNDYWDNPAGVDPTQLLYTTQTYRADLDGTEGAVLIGNTVLYAGEVNGELFMTRGHWHTNRSRGELVVGVSGKGVVLLLDSEGASHELPLSPGQIQWIEGKYAHRTINTGTEPLVFLCTWPADCGHDYDVIGRFPVIR